MEAAGLKRKFVEELSSYSKKEAESLFFIFLEEYAGFRRLDYLSSPKMLLKEEPTQKMLNALRQLKNGSPYQHILGRVEFAGLTLKTSKAALIPRPETEELVYLMKDYLKSTRAYKIIDMGTGTGCIALACAGFFSKASVTGIDISAEAVELAKENAANNRLAVDFRIDDILNPSANMEAEWDVIVSNPPYIARWEGQGMDTIVTDHEPEQALFAPDDNPLLYYKALKKFADSHLAAGGYILLEINERLGKETVEVFASASYRTELRKDMSGKDRFVVAQK